MEEKDKDKGMFKAYQFAQEMIRDRLRDVDENAAKELDAARENEVIVARGSYDYIERVFSQMDIPTRWWTRWLSMPSVRLPNKSCF